MNCGNFKALVLQIFKTIYCWDEVIRFHNDLILKIGDVETKLTTKESELLSLLSAHANDILERNHALKQIWEEDTYFNARSMDVYITKLRKLLRPEPNIEIINIHGKGYKLIVPNEEEEGNE